MNTNEVSGKDAISSDINTIAEFESRPVDTSVAFVLLWVVVNSHNPKNINDNAQLKKILATLTLEKQTLRALIPIARQQAYEDLQQVFALLQTQLSDEEKLFLLQTAVAVAAHHEQLSPSANHILRFLADFLAFDEAKLAELYHQESQAKLNAPEDLSSLTYWRSRETQHAIKDPQGPALSKEQALEILGLESDANTADIKLAYRRLVQQYHPDRHGDGKQLTAEQAEAKFLKVQKAYEVLKL